MNESFTISTTKQCLEIEQNHTVHKVVTLRTQLQFNGTSEDELSYKFIWD